MIGDGIDTFENTTPAVSQEFVFEVKFNKVPVTAWHTRNTDV